MPVRKVKGGYHVANTTARKPLSKKQATKQLAAVKINQAKKKGGY